MLKKALIIVCCGCTIPVKDKALSTIEIVYYKKWNYYILLFLKFSSSSTDNAAITTFHRKLLKLRHGKDLLHDNLGNIWE